MKRLTVLFATGVACLLIATAAQAQNLISDPGFESFPASTNISSSETSKIIANWRYFAVDGASASLSATGDAHSGSIALQLTRNNTAGDTGLDKGVSSLFVPVVAGTTYQGSVWAKTPSSGSLLFIVAYYNRAGNWLGTQSLQTFALTSTYRQCTMNVVPPAGTASVNFALRVAATGSVIVDDCSLQTLPAAPSVTYPDTETVDSFTPTVAFSGVPHTAYQIQILSGGSLVWDSGAVVSTGCTCPVAARLEASGSYMAQVRLQNAAGWGSYCAPVSFSAPALPIVKIASPQMADSIINSGSTAASWSVDLPAGGSVSLQTVQVDSRSPVTLSPTARSYTMTGLTEGIHKVSVTAVTTGGTVADTSTFNNHITPTGGGTLYYYDLSWVNSYNVNITSQRNIYYDVCMAVMALQGLVNRNGANLFVKMTPTDSVWWNRQRASGNWLAGRYAYGLPTGLNNLASVFNTFKSYYNGAVLWDPNVNATSNVATTVAGCDNLIPIRYDPTPGSVYSTLNLPVVVDLTNKFTGSGTIWGTSVPSTGSKKCDAYVWALTNYMNTGKCNPSLLYYGFDAYWLTNGWSVYGTSQTWIPPRDYVVANKGFAFDLDMWGDEEPTDDPTQPLGTDLATYTSMLSAAAARAPGMIDVVGYFPFASKYSNYNGLGGKHEAVSGEWQMIQLHSYYNAYLVCNVFVPNTSLYSHFPLPDRYTQNRKYSQTDLRKLGYLNKSNVVSNLNYLNIYLGDYDGAWVYDQASTFWADSARGTEPLSWAFNPNLVDHFAPMFDYYYRNRSANDSFIAGDSGAGYLNPDGLVGSRPSGLPSASTIWVNHNLKYFRQNNVKITGFIIDGNFHSISSTVDGMYSQFSVDGTFSQPRWYRHGDHMVGSMPALVQQGDLNDFNSDVNSAAQLIQPRGVLGAPAFHNWRSVLVSPTWVKSVFDKVVSLNTSIPWTLVDAPTYTALAKCNMGVIPDNRATYAFDTIPAVLSAGATLSASIGVRNDGWTVWKSPGAGAVSLLLEWVQGTQVVSRAIFALPHDVESGGGVVLSVTVGIPPTPSDYTLHYEMMRDGVRFSSLGDYAWEAPRTVSSDEPGGGTVPPLDVGNPASAKTCPQAKYVTFSGILVAPFGNQYYFEAANRSSGIRVDSDSAALSSANINQEYTIVGYAQLDPSNQERYINAESITPTGEAVVIGPLGFTNRSIGGGDLGDVANGMGQAGLAGGIGTNNLGLLVRTTGTITAVNGANVTIDDGSGVGVEVLNIPRAYNVGDRIAVTGIATVVADGSNWARAIRPRDTSDVTPY